MQHQPEDITMRVLDQKDIAAVSGGITATKAAPKPFAVLADFFQSIVNLLTPRPPQHNFY